MKVSTDKFSSPIYDPRFLFEMLICAETLKGEDGQGGFLHVTKYTHPDTKALLPNQNEQVTIEHGRKLAAWCSMAAAAPSVQPAGKPADPLKAGKLKLWAAIRQLTGAEPTIGAAEKLLKERKILGEAETLAGLRADQFGIEA